MRYLQFAVLCAWSYALSAQINIGGIPYSWQLLDTDKIHTVVMPLLDLAVISAEDEVDEQNGMPPRFGFKHKVEFDIAHYGTSTINPDSSRVWRLGIHCPDALSINLLFDQFWLPEGAVMYIYTPDHTKVIGGFNHRNNKGTRESLRGFGTGIIRTTEIIIEVYEPKREVGQSVVGISGVVHGYHSARSGQGLEKDFGDSGNFHSNVNCPEGDDWQDEKHGVAMTIVDGTRWCTGSLVNNTSHDGRLFFLTADHCLNSSSLDAITNPDASSWSFVWNYEGLGCDNPSVEPALFTTNGAIILANNPDSDFALMELSESPLLLSPQQDIFFNGWSNSETAATNTTCIHHPSNDIKKISFDNDAALSFDYYGGAASNSYWKVIWDDGVTEGGSSGSPLFNENSLIVGQLRGGFSVCGGSDLSDGYGKVSFSWSGNSDHARQLAFWLDPENSNAVTLGGGYLVDCEGFVNITQPIINDDRFIRSSGVITASSSISGISNVEMIASNQVHLITGFNISVLNSGKFEARIAPCVPHIVPIIAPSDPTEVAKETHAYLKIHPNPASEKITVSYGEGKQGKLIITNILGHQVYLDMIDNSGYKDIELSSLPNGIYIVTAHFEDGKMASQKLMLQY